jgi:glutamate N-acetyltransferase/amino-acid N-acetyltransferase
VKTAVHGQDPNWGRVIAALGRSGAEIDPVKIDLYLKDICLIRAGCPVIFDTRKAKSVLSNDKVSFSICLNLGKESATAWGCDLSEEYVTINSAYTT